MLSIQDGQCGMCKHFGENQSDEDKLVQIRISGQAPAELVEPCGLPANAQLHLKVNAASTCDGFERAVA